MIILTEDLLIEYTREHPEAKGSVFRWAGIARAAVWENLVQVRRLFPHADRIGHCVVFNIMGNNYRLVTKIDYDLQAVTLKHFLSHAEYDRGNWKKDC